MREKGGAVENSPELVKAMSEYIRRREGISFPAAVFVDGSWKVLPEELLPCCEEIVESMLFRHCYSVKHIARRYGVSESVLSNALRQQSQNHEMRASFSGGIAYDPSPNPWGLFNELVNWLCARYRCYDLEQEQAALLGRIAAAMYWCKANQHLFLGGSRPLWIISIIEQAKEEVQRLLGPRFRIEEAEGWWLAVEVRKGE